MRRKKRKHISFYDIKNKNITCKHINFGILMTYNKFKFGNMETQRKLFEHVIYRANINLHSKSSKTF